MKTFLQLCRGIGAQSVPGLLAALLLTLTTASVRAHEEQNTHPGLTVGALLFLDQYFPEDGRRFSRNARTWVRQGSIDEDDCPNYVHHFFNPKTGANSTFGNYLARIQLDCPDRLGNLTQQTAPERAAMFWPLAIQDYKAGNYESAFFRLGYIMHLLQDMTSPPHVHNDFHGKAEGTCARDGDDFEMWGFCTEYNYRHIYDYISYVNITNASILPRLSQGLASIFNNQPQIGVLATGEANIAYATVRALAHKVYDFTTFQVRLVDTSSLTRNDEGQGELNQMFPDLVESGGQWDIPGIGYSIGECNLLQQNQEWWLMETGCRETNPDWWTHVVEGFAYIENTGGGSGTLQTVPDTVVPKEWNRDWFSKRYATTRNTNTMLRVYGDVLYSAAVAYGAGLLQAFLDEAIMPRPITQDAAVLDGGTARLHGRVNPGGAVARAWFEWGTGTNYTATESQLVGSGTTFLSIADSITGLLPETVYQFRLVSSNEFGIRHGIPRTLRTLNFSLLTGGVNAWQITDDLAQSGSTLTYITNLTLPQRQAATSNGWQFTINSRLTTDFGGGQTMVFGYGTGPDRFLIWLDFDASGNLSAEIPGLGTYRLTTNGIGTNIYHTHEIRCTNGNATYFFDGTPKGIGWRGSTVNHPAGQVFWGAGSSPGMGQMNFHQVRFETLGVVASYDAGSGGNPPEAPNPVTRGWTNNAGTILLSDHAIAPDGEPFVPAVETLQASDSDTSSAQLNAQVNPHGDATVAWFEWGLTTSYDKRTPIRPVGSGQAHTNFNEPIGGLSPSTVYHCRVVASNGFGIRMGNDRTFQTASYVMTGNLPNAWQITDDSSAANSRWNYTTNLNLEQRSAASNSWRFTIISRLVTDYGGTETMAFVYGNGGRRYAVFWDLDTNGNLTARLEGQTNRIVASNNLGATLYHTHELSYTNSVATYSVDGRVIASWTGTNSTAQPGQAFWGAGFSAGQGQMNFRRVEFQVGGSNVVGTYDAGTQGAPAPDPVTRGWTLDDPGAARATNLTEQLEIFLPTVDTLAATAIGSTSAQLNGRVSANGRETYTWFEWGIRTTYGIRTPEQDGEAGFEAINTSNAISGLAVDTTYHFRVVASNSIATRFGHDQTFRTTWFTDAGIHLPSVNDGSVAWGDCDNDGDLDLLLTGQTDFGEVSRIYRNDGGGSFAQITAPLIGVSHSSAAWGDYDRDGDLDILLSGLSPTGAVSHVYRNDGVNFTAINANLPGVFMSSVAWVDCDNDGDLDILLTGADDATNRLARIYRNDGATNFVNMNAGFEGTSDGAAASGDFDGDADHDFIITGLDSSGTLSARYYRNDGAGVFTHADLNLPAVYSSSIAPADFDNDGDLDLLLSGSSAEGEITRLFRNIRNGPELEFEEVQTILANVSSSSVAWGDFDNDGDPDIALSGWGGKPFTAIYRNDGHGIFLPLTKELTGLFSSSTAWADLDNDGDLDLLLTGRNDEGSAPARALHVYRNVSPIANTAPTAPSGLEGSGVGYSATVNWQPANDSTTPLSALTYNLVLSSVTNGIDIASPMANTTNGYRRIATFGSAGYNHSWTFTGLTPGKYYFSVQAIDSTYVGGPFAPWQSFEVAVPPVVIIASEILQPGRVRIHFAGSDGVAYDVWASADLQAWARLGPGVTLAPGEFEYIDAAAPLNRRFYQIRRVTP